MAGHSLAQLVPLLLLLTFVACHFEWAAANAYYSRPIFSLTSKPYGSGNSYLNPCAACGKDTCALVLQSKPNVYIGCVAGIKVIHRCDPGQLLDVISFACKNVTTTPPPGGNSTTASPDADDDPDEDENQSRNPEKVPADSLKMIVEKLDSLQASMSSQQERHHEDLVVLTKAVMSSAQHNDKAWLDKPKDSLAGISANDQDDDAVSEVVSKLSAKIDSFGEEERPAKDAASGTTAASPTTAANARPDDQPRRRQKEIEQQQLRQLQSMLSLIGMGPATESPKPEVTTAGGEAAEEDVDEQNMRRKLIQLLLKN